MRLHTLEVTAFGPFADRVEVDFDALSEAGLFLLTGATGAGKTSVLDAVCFALYGDVPGDRSAAKRLRSDHAAPGLAPRVSLEATLAGRRFRVVRSPAWERPKRRGSGTTVQQASVTLSERVDGEWVPLTSRIDEAGQLVSGLLGMTLVQFCQVAMLPQGRFQAFLRARSEERHALLQRLFRTGRYEQMERWLRDHRLELRRRSREQHDRIAHLLHRFAEAADQPFPDGWDLSALEEAAAEVEPWADAVADGARAALAAADAADASARAVLQEAASASEAARHLAAAQARHAAAVRALDDLESRHAEQSSRRSRLESADRAAAVAPLLRLAERADRDAGAAAREAGTAVAALARHLGTTSELDLHAVEHHQRTAVEAAARARALLPRRQRLHEAGRELVELDRRRAVVVAAVDDARSALAGLPGRLARSGAAVAAARTARDRLPSALQELQAVERRAAAAVDAARIAAELEEATASHRASVDVLQSLTTTWLDLREQRLVGMAAEIAGRLAVGACCPVCGSADHPSKAASGPGAPDASAERAAGRAVDDAKAVEHAHAARVHDLHSRLAVARGLAGDPDELAFATAAASVRVSALRLDADELAEREAALAAAELDSRTAAAHERALCDDLALLDRSRAALEAECAAAIAAIDAELAGSRHGDLDVLLDDAERTAALAGRAAGALRAHAAAEQAALRQRAALDEALAASGLAGREEARALLLEPAERGRLEALVQQHADALAAAAGVVADPDCAAAAAQPAPDLDRLDADLRTAQREAEQSATDLDRRRRCAARLSGLRAELAVAWAAWTPVRRELDVATSLSAFVDGRSPDNRLQMRLSAYVLAYRLSQVVAAANERLHRMSDQRYSLEHTGQRGAGETRGGLSLLVRDDWSGDTRDPATLSGGETFVVSLALALGLADVIAHEAGGAELDTLFVDEGFGSLDADTLDDVMDTLDSLRDGGRVVGVVSHVGEMRDRIPTQLRVVKQRSGSLLETTRG